MHPADPGTHLSKRCQERLHLLRIPHDNRKRSRPKFLCSGAGSWFRAPFCTPAPHGRPPGLRKPLQKIATPGIHGGFYSYFKSKSDLYAEVLTCFFTDPNWKSCWEGVKVDLSTGDVGPQFVRAYLSRQH